jgi:methyl-accepting chemotaxis protein
MNEMPFASGSAFRRRLMIGNALLQVCAGAVVGLYLVALLQLTSEQWREFLFGTVVFAGVCALVETWILSRVDRAVVACIDAQVGGAAHQELFRRGFEAVMDLPRRMFFATQIAWLIAAITIPGWMMLRLDDFSGIQSPLIAVVALMGGFVAGIFLFFVVKRLVAPLRDHWARELADATERQGLIRRLTLSRKLGIAVSGVMVSTVFATALLSYSLSFRPIEAYSTRVQAGYVARMAQRIVGPADPLLDLVKEDLDELGIAGQLAVVELSSGRIVAGPPEALTATELRWIADSEVATGTSLEIDSDNSFAWSRVEDDEDYALVAVTPRDLLIGDLGRVQLAFGLLLLMAFVIALIAAFLMAGDVSRTTKWLRLEAERIASGDLTRGDVQESEDELGDMARSFEGMFDSLRATVRRVSGAAERVDAEAAAIAKVGLSLASTTVDQVQGVKRASGSMATINGKISGITEEAQILSGNVEEASSSILELGAAGEELNQTASMLTSQITDVSSSIEEMIRSVSQVSENTEALAGAVSETSASMAQMAESMQQVESAAVETAGFSSQVVSLAESGQERVRQTIGGMDAIREATSSADVVIRGLGARVQEIGAIVDVIDDVADETNLLALNAAIIAAQAGDQGRAFSVVADEIKDLADRVLASTKEIGTLIRAVQQESSNAIGAIEGGTRSVESGVELSAEAGVSLDEITRAARASGVRIEEIVQAVREQAGDTSRVSDLMAQVNRAVDEIRAGGKEQERGNETVMRGTVVIRDVALQTQRTTEEQARGAGRFRDSIESVREAVEKIHAALQEQSEECRHAVSFLEQIYERTRSNEDSSRRMSEATKGLQQQADALREDVRRFRIE